MIKVDADTFFRAITAAGFKLMAYHFNLDTGEIISRALCPDEVTTPLEESGVKPLPKLGGDLTSKKKAAPFVPALVVESKKKLFDDADRAKEPTFKADFWKRDEKKKLDLFEEIPKRSSGSRKLAEIFGESEPQKTSTTQSQSQSSSSAANSGAVNSRCPRIPVVSETEQLEWIRAFAKDFGDPTIRDEMYAALKSVKPLISFSKVLRKHQRMSQQWELYFRKTALDYGEVWLSQFGIQWELLESDWRRRIDD